MIGYVALLLVIIILMTIGFIRAKNDSKRELEKKEQEWMMPSGEFVPCDEELLQFTKEDLNAYSKDDLMWLINYIGHKMSKNEKKWGNLYTLASRVKNYKRW